MGQRYRRHFESAALVVAALVASTGCGADAAPASEQDSAVAHAEPTTTAAQGLSTCVTFQRGLYGLVSDTQVASNPDAAHPGGNFGTNLAMITGKVGAGLRETLLNFDLNAIPPGSIIDSASLTVHARPGNVTDPAHPVNVHRLDVGWFESTVSWDSFYSGGAPFSPSLIFASTPSAPGALSFGVASLVTDWLANGNGGALLEQGGSAYTNFYTSEDPIVTNRPSLQVCYTAPPCAGGVDLSVTDNVLTGQNPALYAGAASASGYVAEIDLSSVAGPTPVVFTVFTPSGGMYASDLTIAGPGAVPFVIPSGQRPTVHAGDVYGIEVRTFAAPDLPLTGSFTTTLSCSP